MKKLKRLSKKEVKMLKKVNAYSEITGCCGKIETCPAHKTAPELLEFIRDLVIEPFRMKDEDEREKTIFEAKELIAKTEGR